MKKSLFSHLKQPEAALAASILYQIDELVGFNGIISKRNLERKMNANKQPLWPAAWQILIREGCIQVSPGKNRQQFVKIARISKHLQARWIVTKPRQRRPPTPWFVEHLPEFLARDGYAAGIEGEEVEEYGPWR